MNAALLAVPWLMSGATELWLRPAINGRSLFHRSVLNKLVGMKRTPTSTAAWAAPGNFVLNLAAGVKSRLRWLWAIVAIVVGYLLAVGLSWLWVSMALFVGIVFAVLLRNRFEKARVVSRTKLVVIAVLYALGGIAESWVPNPFASGDAAVVARLEAVDSHVTSAAEQQRSDTARVRGDISALARQGQSNYEDLNNHLRSLSSSAMISGKLGNPLELPPEAIEIYMREEIERATWARADAAAASGELERAARLSEEYDRSIENTQGLKEHQSLVLKGNLAWARWDLELAASLYRQALEIVPENPEVLNKAAVALDQTWRSNGSQASTQCLQWWRKAYRITEGDKTELHLLITHNLAVALLSSGEASAAEDMLRVAARSAAEICTGCCEARIWIYASLARTLLINASAEEALEHANRALKEASCLESVPDSITVIAHVSRASELASRGDVFGADAAFDAAEWAAQVDSAANPRNLSTVLSSRGDWELSVGWVEGALGHFVEAHGILLSFYGGDHPLVTELAQRTSLARCFVDRDSDCEIAACEALAAHEQKHPTDELGKAIRLSAVAGACEAQGEYAQAQGLLLEALTDLGELKLNSWHARLLNQLGNLQMNMGDISMAECSLSHALAIARQLPPPGDSEIYRYEKDLEDLYLPARDVPEAGQEMQP